MFFDNFDYSVKTSMTLALGVRYGASLVVRDEGL
jgi:hypothetical protein